MEVTLAITVLSAFLTISSSFNFAEKVNKNEESHHLSDDKITSFTGSDVAELMQKLTEMLQEVQDRDKETRKMVEEVIGNKPRVKRSRQKRCRGDVCEPRPTFTNPPPTTRRQTESQTESTSATSQEITVSTEKPTTVGSTTSPSSTLEPFVDETTTSTPNLSTHPDDIETSTYTEPSTTRSSTQSTLEPFVDETTTSTPNLSTHPGDIETSTYTEPSTTRITTQSAHTNFSILAPTPPPEREIEIPFVTNNGRCFNEHCPQKPFVYVPGRSGMSGAPGERGDRGDRGPKGEAGDPGLPGANGERGPNGPKGDVGVPGISGMKGTRGIVGPRGNEGQKGDQGQKGEMGEDITTETRTVYTRWGARDCPGTSELVFEGYAAGAAYDQKGGGTSYLCLPRDPVFNYYRSGVDTWRGYLYGSEYEENDFPPLVGKDDGDVPCAVCLVTDRSVVIMQPARTDCPEGWTREYFGYLMASAYIYYRSEWTCVDGNATLVSSESLPNSNGALFYPTEVCCGNANTGLPCDIYPNGYELTCSVCSL